MFAYLQSLPPVAQPNRAHTLAFPFGTQAALAVWRALYFRPAVHVDDPARSAEWNRGAYLVEGLGHCNACHSARNALGATRGTLDLQGGLIPVQNWYAPSLASPREASVAGWPKHEVVQLLKTGVAPQGFVMGPMSDVVLNSTQHLSDADLAAMATYLQALPPPTESDPPPAALPAPSARGAALYKDHCVACHGERGEGVPGAYPALAGSRAVTMRSAGQPGAHRPRGRLSAEHRRQPAAVRHAAVRAGAAGRRRRRAAQLRARLLGQPGRAGLGARRRPGPRGPRMKND